MIFQKKTFAKVKKAEFVSIENILNEYRESIEREKQTERQRETEREKERESRRQRGFKQWSDHLFFNQLCFSKGGLENIPDLKQISK